MITTFHPRREEIPVAGQLQRNVISKAMLNLSDGGGIYTCCAQTTGATIKENFVYDPSVPIDRAATTYRSQAILMTLLQRLDGTDIVVHINQSSLLPRGSKIRLLDLQGRTISHISVPAPGVSGSISFRIRKPSVGAYVFEVESSSGDRIREPVLVAR